MPTYTAADAPLEPEGPAVANGDEGEPQTAFLNPPEGGAYRRNPDGSLTRVEDPTRPPNPQPVQE